MTTKKLKEQIKELKEWVVSQREVLANADNDWFKDIGETKEDWLECELLYVYQMISLLRDK